MDVTNEVGNFEARSGGAMQAFDSTNADNISMSHDGTDAVISCGNTTDLNITGIVSLKVAGSLLIVEQASADTDDTSYGQFWIKSTAPNMPMYTDGEGKDSFIMPERQHTTADDTATADTTFSDLTGLGTCNLLADQWYQIVFKCRYNQNVGNAKFAFQESQTPAIQKESTAIAHSTGDDTKRISFIGTTGVQFTTMTDTQDVELVMTSIIKTHATVDATVGVRVAQETSSANATTFYAGASLEVTHLGAG